ncbi:hypothetical protein NE645_18245, partial [Roseburia hominis]|nr:hypothetical protein [Roseburia hominis]
PKAALECIYNNATLSVRKIGKFDYELAVDRVVAYDIEGVISAADEVDTVNGHQVVYNVVVSA